MTVADGSRTLKVGLMLPQLQEAGGATPRWGEIADTVEEISHGRFHRARDCELKPRGPRSSGPELMIGTNLGSPRMQRIAALWADSWNLFYDNTANRADGFASAVGEFEAACRDVGRDPTTFGATATVLVADASADPWWDRLPSDNYAGDGPLRPLAGIRPTSPPSCSAMRQRGRPTSRSRWNPAGSTPSRRWCRCSTPSTTPRPARRGPARK